jgi:hypothetical protein
MRCSSSQRKHRRSGLHHVTFSFILTVAQRIYSS